MAGRPTPELDATVTGSGDLVVPAKAVSQVVKVSPGDQVKIHIVTPPEQRKNMYGVFADLPIGLDADDLTETRMQMWSGFATDLET